MEAFFTVTTKITITINNLDESHITWCWITSLTYKDRPENKPLLFWHYLFIRHRILEKKFSKVQGFCHFGALIMKFLKRKKAYYPHRELPGCLSSKESACQCKRHGFDPWVSKITSRRKWQPSPVFLPGKSHGQRSLEGYSSWGCKKVRLDLEIKTTTILRGLRHNCRNKFE